MNEETHWRWEWRTFGDFFGRADEAFAALTPTGIQESDEQYFLSARHSPDINIKVRFDLLDVKTLDAVNEDRLEQWHPILKANFPIDRATAAEILKALGIADRVPEQDSYTLQEFTERVAALADLRSANVHKRRVRYVVGGCTSEVSEVVVDGKHTRTIAIEAEDPNAVRAAVELVGLKDYLNTSYGIGLLATLADAPERYAIIDVGTNSVKFHIAERRPDGTFARVKDRAEITRIGEGMGETGRIAQEPMERTADAIADMVGEAKQAGTRAIAAVATAAFRIAENSTEAVDLVRTRTGVTIEPISGDDESRLAYIGAVGDARVGEGTTLVFDTGGGSSQFTFGHGATLDERFSVNVGAAHFTEQFGLDQKVSAEAVAAALAAIAESLPELDNRPRPDAVVGMGGAITNMTAVSLTMPAYDPDAIHGATLDLAEIDRQIELYRTRSADERRAIVGLQPKRAEVILAGACIVRTVLVKLGQDSLKVSDRGLRHGILIERFGIKSSDSSAEGGRS